MGGYSFMGGRFGRGFGVFPGFLAGTMGMGGRAFRAGRRLAGGPGHRGHQGQDRRARLMARLRSLHSLRRDVSSRSSERSVG